MRARPTLLTLVTGTALVALALPAVPSAAAATAPAQAPAGWSPVASYCSPSGDVCFGIRRKGDRVKLRLDSFVDFGDVSFCVKKAGGRYRCQTRTLQPRDHDLYFASILWNRYFPTAGAQKRVVRFAGYPKRLSFVP